MNKTKYPGVWRLPSGGYHVRTSAIDPRSGKLLTRKRNLPATATLRQAIQEVGGPSSPQAAPGRRPAPGGAWWASETTLTLVFFHGAEISPVTKIDARVRFGPACVRGPGDPAPTATRASAD
jgi:hypothetical protein